MYIHSEIYESVYEIIFHIHATFLHDLKDFKALNNSVNV